MRFVRTVGKIEKIHLEDTHENHVSMWADEGLIDVIRSVKGVVHVHTTYPTMYHITVDKRYDVDVVIENIIFEIRKDEGVDVKQIDFFGILDEMGGIVAMGQTDTPEFEDERAWIHIVDKNIIEVGVSLHHALLKAYKKIKDRK